MAIRAYFSDSLLVENNASQWAYELILSLANLPESMVDPDREAFILPNAISRSLIIALPQLLKRNMHDIEVRVALYRLVGTRHFAVLKLLCEQLRDFWLIDSEFTLKCLLIGIQRALYKDSNRTTYLVAEPAQQGVQELLPNLIHHDPRAVDYYQLRALQQLFDFEKIIQSLHRVEAQAVVTGILDITIRAHKLKYEAQHDSYLASNLWNFDPIVGDLLASWMTSITFEDAQSAILHPLLQGWREHSELLRETMLSIAVANANQQLSLSHFLQMWKYIGNSILENMRKASLPDYFPDHEDRVIKSLIFVDSRLKTQTAQIMPIDELEGLFADWGELFGHKKYGFDALLRFYQGLFPRKELDGIPVLATALSRISEPNFVFGDTKVTQRLELLTERIWRHHAQALQKDAKLRHQFFSLVDVLAQRGSTSAVSIRRKLYQ